MISEFTKLRALIVIVHCLGVYGVYCLWDPVWFCLSLVCVFAFLWLGQEMYCHRFLSHASFEMPKKWQRACALLSVYNLFGNPIGIASTHVNHHKYSDTDLDPHPASYPVQSWLWIYPEFATSRNIGVTKRLMRDPWLVFIGRNYFKIYLSTVFVLSLIDLKIVIYGMFIPVIYAIFCDGIVNVVCHIWGYRRYDSNDESKNNLIGNAVLMFSGIAMHNNHHAYPSSHNMSRAWYEIDLVGLLINVIRIRR